MSAESNLKDALQTEFENIPAEKTAEDAATGMASAIHTHHGEASGEETVEAWHEIGGGGEPTFENSWSNYGSGFESAAFMKNGSSVVRLKGLIRFGTVGSTAFTLPAGYRPVARLLNGTISNSAVGRVDIYSDGTVVPTTPSNNTWVALDGITFLAEG